MDKINELNNLIKGKVIEEIRPHSYDEMMIYFQDGSSLKIETYTHTDSCGDTTSYDFDFTIEDTDGKETKIETKYQYGFTRR